MDRESTPWSEVLDRAPRFLFFTGKGGVGKTSLSCATAVTLAEQGRRVLLISTDPASNLDEVLGATLTSTPIRLDWPATLWALNIDPDTAAREYRERVMAPYRDTLPAAMVDGIEEQLSGACTTEIAAFNEFSRYLGHPEATAEYDHVIFDTAPTGHTLRLLQLPAAWNHFIDTNTSGTSCLGPLTGLAGQKDLYAATLDVLRDPSRTQLVLVSRPERSALAEAERSRSELAALGLRNLHLILNGLFAGDHGDPVARAMADRQRKALASLPSGLRQLAHSDVALRPFNLTGVKTLAALLKNTEDDPRRDIEAVAPGYPATTFPPLSELVRDIETKGNGVILVMGKGGVGKTTLAAAIAVDLASRGHRVHLTTTDPAAHLEHALNGVVPNLEISRIDPIAETAAYARDVMATAGAGLDEEGRDLLAEDLRSPCTEEIAVFRAFAGQVDRGRNQFVVLDTAPTGHTLLLLDATESYHREVSRNRNELPEAVRHLLPRLRDPQFSKVILVTLPEYTPVHEALSLQADLRRAGIEPYAWVINQILSAFALSHPVLRARQDHERPHIEDVQATASRLAVVPWQLAEPIGIAALKSMTAATLEMEAIS